ncbi:MAG: alpha amylase C-terminal domain-containing protein [Cyclobacteriaceae bacterium]
MVSKKRKVVTLTESDPWLAPYEEVVRDRIDKFESRIAELKKQYGGLKKFAEAYKTFGLNYDKKSKNWIYREWAPGANKLALVGDFNGWNENSHSLEQKEGGIWEIRIDGDTLKHGTKFKVRVFSQKGTSDRIPAYADYVTQDANTHDFSAEIYQPAKSFKWTDKQFSIGDKKDNLYIYECHVGMAQEEEKVGTYREFADKILPRIVNGGYNAIQVMAIQEHPYYGSFGYHVSNFFAPSSRFGTPDDLKYLVNVAHDAGLVVIMDLVHSHAVKNTAEGLNEFDGTDHQYFHGGGKGDHSAWDSKLFNYGKIEVQQFLLSNVRYWLEEFHIDGFRYDGVTSMLYTHHGDHISFDHYDKYFDDLDHDVVLYLQLATALAQEIKPGAVIIAEDMSGLPGLCRPVEEGGVGFDYRLAMGIPDYWIKLLKHKPDEEWNIHEMWGTLTNRRYGEKTIAYAESHDQALVGDKTLAFWLMDKEMYYNMHISSKHLAIDRGLALHKLIRFFTLSLGGEGYLNFIGNEFGHPEWVDFPREGNDWSYKYARRQWSLADSEELKYQFLLNFDKEMVKCARENTLVSSLPAKQLNMDETNHVIIFERNNLIFVFNFHPVNSIPDYRFKVENPGQYCIILNSDKEEYGGFTRIDDEMSYPAVTLFGEHFLSVYVPNRTCLVLRKKAD